MTPCRQLPSDDSAWGEKQRQGLCRRKQPLAVLGQQRLDPIEPFGASQPIEHRVGIRAACVMAYASLLPPSSGDGEDAWGLAPRVIAVAS